MIARLPSPDPCLKSNPEFLLELFQEQSTPLLKFLTSRLRDREDAAEIAQEAWLRMHRLEHPRTALEPEGLPVPDGVEPRRRSRPSACAGAARQSRRDAAIPAKDSRPPNDPLRPKSRSNCVRPRCRIYRPTVGRRSSCTAVATCRIPTSPRNWAFRRAWSRSTSPVRCGTCATG